MSSSNIVSIFATRDQPLTLESGKLALPKTIFHNIIGYDTEKVIFDRALKSNHPVHILLNGPPGCGKTEFLKCIMNANKDETHFVLDATKAGLLETLFVKKPKYLLVDEIEHLKNHDIVVLLSLMEAQLISETKIGKTREAKLNTWVFATCNNMSKLPPALISRFYVMIMDKYTRKQFTEIAAKILPARTGVPEETALYIADQLYGRNLGNNTNVRDALKVARLAGNHKEAIDVVIQRMA